MNRWRKKNGRFDRHLNGRAEKYGWKMERWISYHGISMDECKDG